MYFVPVVYFVIYGHVGFVCVMHWTKISPFASIHRSHAMKTFNDVGCQPATI